jgi:membrane-associated phospholipid phosphatase
MQARNDRSTRGWRRRHWLAFGWACAATLAFIAVLALVLLGDTRSLDLAATGVVQRLPTPGVLGLMVGVSWLGYEPQAALLALAALLGLLLRRHPHAALFTALAILLTRLDAPLKAFANRARPSAMLDGVLVRGSVGGASFPSGHVFTYTIVGGFLAYFAYTHIDQPVPRRLVTGLLLLLIALVGPSRLYLGAHWLTDVLGSYLLGSALLVVLLLVYRATGAGGRDPDDPEAT